MLAQRMALSTMTSAMAILKATMMRGTLVLTITIVASILMVPLEEDRSFCWPYKFGKICGRNMRRVGKIP